MRTASALVLLLAAAASAGAGVREVELSLPVRPKLKVTGREKIYLGPFLEEIKGDTARPKMGFSVAAEFERNLRRLLRKETKLVLVSPLEGLRPPTDDALVLAQMPEFWRELGARAGVDYIVSGIIDFEIQDRSGYQTEEYVSPLDGRTYYRQVMVEQTGFAYDILIQVFDGRSGELTLEEPMKDFRQVQERNFDEFTGMFANLFALENQLIGIFVPRNIKSKRFLFTP